MKRISSKIAGIVILALLFIGAGMLGAGVANALNSKSECSDCCADCDFLRYQCEVINCYGLYECWTPCDTQCLAKGFRKGTETYDWCMITCNGCPTSNTCYECDYKVQNCKGIWCWYPDGCSNKSCSCY